MEILCIEDNTYNQRLLRQILRRHSVTMVGSAAELRQYLANTPVVPDIVLADVNLPDSSGAEQMFVNIVSPIRSCWPQVPIIAQTAKAMSGDEEVLLRGGCNDYLSKPFVRQDLLAKIAEWTK